MLDNTSKRRLVLEIISVGIIIAILHQLALTLYLYWTLDWFDILMHTLGGVFGGLVVMYFVGRLIKEPKKYKLVVFYVVISAVLVVGLTWELWELFIGFSDRLEDLNDTIIDLIMDTIGAIIAFLYASKKVFKIDNVKEI